MPEQLHLLGFEPEPVEEKNFFFAVMPPPPAAEEIATRRHEVCIQHRLDGKPMAPDRLHVSLHNIGDPRTRPMTIELAQQAATRAAQITLPFEVKFDLMARFGGRFNGHALALCSKARQPGMEALSSNLANMLTEYSFPVRSGKKLNAHVTTMYGDTPETPIAVPPVTWTVKEFVLLESFVGKSRYRELGRWRFAV